MGYLPFSWSASMFANKLSRQAAFVLSLMSVMLVLLLASGVSAMQVERQFPEGTKRGKLSTTELADLVIDGKLRVSSPALRIYNEENAIVLPASLYVKNVLVHYWENDIGEIQRVWILSADEARRPLPKF